MNKLRIQSLVAVFVVLYLGTFSSAQSVDITLRLGQGGFSDDRAPDGKLGGGQIALDIKLNRGICEMAYFFKGSFFR